MEGVGRTFRKTVAINVVTWVEQFNNEKKYN